MEREINPAVIVPNRDFLVGVLYGFNAARKRFENDIKPLYSKNGIMKDAENEDFYLGYWLEITCGKCGTLYTFDNPNELPIESLKCSNKECDNILILYNINKSECWRIGNITF